MSNDPTGKTVLISGGARGIGAELAVDGGWSASPTVKYVTGR